MKKLTLMRQAAVLSLVMLIAWLLPLFGYQHSITAKAISTDYPAQLMNIATKDNSKVLTENGTTDGSALSVKALGNDLSPSWRFDWVGSDSKGTFFKIINAQSGRLLTPQNYKVSAGTDVIIYGSESDKTQHWYVVPVKTDHLGNNLYYKIVNYSDTSLALTQGSSGMTLASYAGADNQLWLLNSDGLQGFAGYCKNDNTNNIKAGDIGGLFGQVVEVTTFDDLKEYAESTTPYTIVVTKNISLNSFSNDGNGQKYTAPGRIQVASNKTIIGSYNAHTLNNVAFTTEQSNKGNGSNVIIKNFDIQHSAEANGNDNIMVYFRGGQNLWVDHVTFTGHDKYNPFGTDNSVSDKDKFLACCYYADYCTVSDCSFGLHEYGIILGYPDSSASNYAQYNGYPRMTLASNKFYKTLTRAPGLMRWGYFHSLNNYVSEFSMAYTVQANTNIFAENCFYENNSTSGNVCCDWNQPSSTDQNLGYFLDSGSKSSGKVNRLTAGQGTSSNPSYAKVGTWKASSNYSYVSLSADNAKTYCNSYSGCQTAGSKYMYLRFAKAGVPSAGYTEAPSGPMKPVAATFAEGSCYRIKNVNSGLYMQVAGAAAENGANVQQWGSNGSDIHDIWKLCSAGDGYYYIVSAVGDGGTYVLDVAGKKADNGTNIDIYKYNGGTNQQFMIAANSDGSYKILTRVSGENSAVEIINASKESGANVQEWESNGVNCQDWIFESVSDVGTAMDTSVVYTFENVNSGMVMDIVNGSMAEGSNVQQWGSNGFDCQKWTLKAFGSGNYYWIRSLSDENYALKAENSTNGGNIDIVAYSSKDSAQLFRFTKNLDGSYSILTHASKDKCLVEVGAASKESGANVQQWEPTNSPCQDWNLVTETTTVATTTTTTTTTTTATTTATVTTTVPAGLKGDVNGDRTLSLADLVSLQSWLLGKPLVTPIDPENSDINDDGIVDVFDYILIQKIPEIYK